MWNGKRITGDWVQWNFHMLDDSESPEKLLYHLVADHFGKVAHPNCSFGGIHIINI